MDPASKAQSPLKSLRTSPFGPNLPQSPHGSFPIIAVAIIGILATALLLVGYYIFVIKCCLSWHRMDVLRRFSFSRRRRPAENPPPAYHSPAPAGAGRGLDEAVIRSIPIFEFRRLKNGKKGESLFKVLPPDCAVCLNEFQEEEKLRVIPNCTHVFHIDCIDAWLQNNANCPLCRTSVSPFDRAISPGLYGPDEGGDYSGRDEDYVLIELGPETGRVGPSMPGGIHESLNRYEAFSTKISKGKKVDHVSSMGDECIGTSRKDESFGVQPMRRSFSMDSSVDTQLSLAVEEIIQRQREVNANDTNNEGCSKVRRSFFTFGQGKGSSRSAIQPVE